ncbi:MAG: radical SAM protein [Alphaproteobacteria bacterium]
MASVGIMPDQRYLPCVQPQGKFFTFILPAPNGCNLACAFCLIRQRQEINASTLKPADYARFIRETASLNPIYAISIQGYEPLLPATLPYTQAVLATGRLLNLPTDLVTNGLGLRNTIPLLKATRPDRLVVSLDASAEMAAHHDHLRGKNGAWEATVDGIACAAAELPSATQLNVASVLIPSRRDLLDGMPELLAKLGVRHWIINPLQKVGNARPGGPADNHERLYTDLLRLQDAADRESIQLEIDDELNCLNHVQAAAQRPELKRLNVRHIPQGVELIRLLPDGELATGRDILRRQCDNAPRWNPACETTAQFWDRNAMSG